MKISKEEYEEAQSIVWDYEDQLIEESITRDKWDEMKRFSQRYRLMIYFAHSTMVMYSKDIISNEKMGVNEFMKENKDIIKRVYDEGVSIMKYVLSNEQMAKASQVYLLSKYYPSSVYNTDVYKLE